MRKIFFAALIVVLTSQFSFAQEPVRRHGLPNGFPPINTNAAANGAFDGVIAHIERGFLGQRADTWMTMGRGLPALAPSGREYGLTIQESGRLAHIGLTGAPTRTFDLQWGGPTTGSMNFFFTPDGTLGNRNMVMRLRNNGFLEAFDRIRAYSSTDNTAEFVDFFHDGTAAFFNSQGDGDIRFRLNNQVRMRLSTSNLGEGALAINRNNSNFNLDVGGNARNTTGSWTTSDERFKKNIEAMPVVSQSIMQLKGLTYQMRQEKIGSVDLTNDDGQLHFGFLAQDVEKVFPDLVKMDQEGFLALRYEGLIPVLVEGFKEQQNLINLGNDEIANLNNEITEQEKLIANLTERLGNLEVQLRTVLRTIDK